MQAGRGVVAGHASGPGRRPRQRLTGHASVAAVRRPDGVRLALCDPQLLYAEPLAAALRARGCEVFLAATPAQAVRLLDEQDLDLCLMEVQFPFEDGVDAVARLAGREPRRPVVVLSGVTDPVAPTIVVEAGATAFLSKDAPVAAIVDALRRVAVGKPVRAFPAPRPVAPPASDRHAIAYVEPLTRRELDVLRGLVRAEDTDQIARSLGVAPSTVRSHLQSVYVKLGVSSRIQAVARALQQRLVEDP